MQNLTTDQTTNQPAIQQWQYERTKTITYQLKHQKQSTFYMNTNARINAARKK